MKDNKHLYTYDDIVASPDLIALDVLERDGSDEFADYILPHILCDDGGVIEWRLTYRAAPVSGWFCSITDVETNSTCYMSKVNTNEVDTVSDNSEQDEENINLVPFESPEGALDVILEIAKIPSGEGNIPTPTTDGTIEHNNNAGEDDYDDDVDDLYEDYRKQRFHLYERVSEAAWNILGTQLTDAAYADYRTFRAAFRRLTVDTKHRGIQTTHMSNALLCVRYPFLVPYNIFDGHVCWDGFNNAAGSEYMDNPLPDGFDLPVDAGDDGVTSDGGMMINDTFSHTHFDALEPGWQRRFGLEMMEDIRLSCYDPDYNTWLNTMVGITVEQIKEKFGALRFYIAGGTDRTSDVINIYGDISGAICHKCGRAYGVRMARGWIVPECFVCSSNGRTRTSYFDERDALIEWAGDAYDHTKNYIITRAYEMNRFINRTTPSPWTADEMNNFHNSWVFVIYSGDGRRDVNKAIGFLDGSLAPNGDEWRINSVIDGIVWELREFEKTLESGWHSEHYSEYDIHEALDILGRDITPWYPIDDDGSKEDSKS